MDSIYILNLGAELSDKRSFVSIIHSLLDSDNENFNRKLKKNEFIAGKTDLGTIIQVTKI